MLATGPLISVALRKLHISRESCLFRFSLHLTITLLHGDGQFQGSCNTAAFAFLQIESVTLERSEEGISPVVTNRKMNFFFLEGITSSESQQEDFESIILGHGGDFLLLSALT